MRLTIQFGRYAQLLQKRYGNLAMLRSAAMASISVVLAIGIACPPPVDAGQAFGSTVDKPRAQTVQVARTDAPESPTDPTLKLSSSEALRKFEPP